MQAYVTRRRAWLSGHSNTLLRKTVYRMDALQSLIDEANWDLRLPISVRGQIVDQDAFERDAPVRVSAEIVEMRMLRLRQPFLQGEDVRELQVALAANNVNVDTDGIFGPATEKAVRQFQSQNGLVADGIAGPATLAALNIRI
jgi:chitosanase